MIAFLTVILVVLALFVNPNWAVVLVLSILALNAGKLYYGWKDRKNDPIEWGKTVIVNGGMVILCIGLLIWSCT